MTAATAMTSLDPVFSVGWQLEEGAAPAHGHDRPQVPPALDRRAARSLLPEPERRIDADPSQLSGR
jgi:ABC-type microcin C transport system duplicated ATPase subunit YejF